MLRKLHRQISRFLSFTLCVMACSYVIGQNVPERSSQRYDRIGIYNWEVDLSGYPNGYSGVTASDKVNWAANLTTSQGARTVRIKLHPELIYGLTPGTTLKQTVVNNSAYQTLFSNSNINTYLITTFPTQGAGPHSWAFRGSNISGDTQNSFFTDLEEQREQTEFQELGDYLLSQYPTKTFIILNWEGDDALFAFAETKNSNGTYVLSNSEALEIYDANVKWNNARAEGIRQARINYTGGGTPKLYSGYEFKLVNRDDNNYDPSTTPRCGSTGTRQNRCAIDYVAPRVKTDYFSYSAYQTTNRLITSLDK